MIRVDVLDPNDVLLQRKLFEYGILTIGRDLKNDIVIPAAILNKFHGEISCHSSGPIQFHGSETQRIEFDSENQAIISGFKIKFVHYGPFTEESKIQNNSFLIKKYFGIPLHYLALGITVAFGLISSLLTEYDPSGGRQFIYRALMFAGVYFALWLSLAASNRTLTGYFKAKESLQLINVGCLLFLFQATDYFYFRAWFGGSRLQNITLYITDSLLLLGWIYACARLSFDRARKILIAGPIALLLAIGAFTANLGYMDFGKDFSFKPPSHLPLVYEIMQPKAQTIDQLSNQIAKLADQSASKVEKYRSK